MIYKVGVNGAAGRMGIELCALLQEGEPVGGKAFELSDAVNRSSKLQSVEGIPVRDWASAEREPVHIWIDFSQPEGTLEMLAKIDRPAVIATTGLTEVHWDAIRAYAQNHPILVAANTSPGVHILSWILSNFPGFEKTGYELILSEEHHKHKKDSPSGTAKSLAALAEDKGYSPTIHSSRVGETRGIHTLRFVCGDETIELRHQAIHRGLFARGALLAAAFLLDRPPGLYSMENVFGEK